MHIIEDFDYSIKEKMFSIYEEWFEKLKKEIYTLLPSKLKERIGCNIKNIGDEYDEEIELELTGASKLSFTLNFDIEKGLKIEGGLYLDGEWLGFPEEELPFCYQSDIKNNTEYILEQIMEYIEPKYDLAKRVSIRRKK